MDSYPLVEQTSDFVVVAGPAQHPRMLSRLSLVSEGDYHVIEAGGSQFEVWCARSGMLTSSPDRQITLVLRGELYGQPFSSDRQRLIEAYMCQGTDFLKHLNGSFCLILLDARDGTCIAATDRLNSTKIYMSESGDDVAFSSSIFLHPARRLTVDTAAVAGYLASGIAYNSRTPFNEIRVMERASICQYHARKLRKSIFWEYCFSNEYVARPYNQLKHELRELLVEAVKVRMPPNSPPFISLSAGYDSTTILGIIGSCIRLPEAQCFSYAFGQPTPSSDEFLSQRMAMLYGYPFRVIPSFTGNLKTVIERNARLGQGTSHFCHEVDAWFELGHTGSRPDARWLFVGDECMGWINRPMLSYTDVLQAVGISDFSRLHWLERYMDKASVRLFSEAVREDILTMLKRCPKSGDLHDAKDYLYLDQRLSHLIMPWRENFPGRFFTVANPLLDNTILDFIQKVPSTLRRGKRLFKDTVRDMFPDLFRIRRAQSSSFTSYLDQALQAQKAELTSLMAPEVGMLDAILPPEVLVRILQDYAYAPPRSRLWDRPKHALRRVLRGTAWYGWAAHRVRGPGQVATSKFLERALVLRTFLADITAQEHSVRRTPHSNPSMISR
jgi:asparagine synthase (glutamine-hydrolysing)